ncbi:MAG: class D sortase, partial [Anaerobacillus sp.]
VIIKKDSPTLTLTTCYPFDFLGSAPDRYIIEANLVHMKPEEIN